MSDIRLDTTARDWQTLHSSFRWIVPARYNIAQACCGRWAEDRSRFALYYEDEAGYSEAWSFWDVQQAANLSLIHIFACDTDGIDGSEDNAGAMVLPDTPARAIAAGIDLRARLAQNLSLIHI